MKKPLQVWIPILCVSFLCGVVFASKPEKVKDFHVLKVPETSEVVIDATDSVAKPKMKFDIFKTGRETIAADPNNIIGGIELP